MERRTCVVSNQDCEAPAGWGVPGFGYAEGDVSTRLTCYVCGEPACRKCSRIVIWYGRRVRACVLCVADD